MYLHGYCESCNTSYDDNKETKEKFEDCMFNVKKITKDYGIIYICKNCGAEYKVIKVKK